MFYYKYMLTVKHIANGEIDNIYKSLGLDEDVSGANFVMYDEMTPVALWRMKILFEDKPIGLIDKIFFIDGVQDDDKLFFVHAMFFKLIDGAPMLIRVEGKHDTLKRFGFEEVNDNMEINSQNINLHYMCASRH